MGEQPSGFELSLKPRCGLSCLLKLPQDLLQTLKDAQQRGGSPASLRFARDSRGQQLVVLAVDGREHVFSAQPAASTPQGASVLELDGESGVGRVAAHLTHKLQRQKSMSEAHVLGSRLRAQGEAQEDAKARARAAIMVDGNAVQQQAAAAGRRASSQRTGTRSLTPEPAPRRRTTTPGPGGQQQSQSHSQHSQQQRKPGAAAGALARQSKTPPPLSAFGGSSGATPTSKPAPKGPSRTPPPPGTGRTPPPGATGPSPKPREPPKPKSLGGAPTKQQQKLAQQEKHAQQEKQAQQQKQLQLQKQQQLAAQQQKQQLQERKRSGSASVGPAGKPAATAAAAAAAAGAKRAHGSSAGPGQPGASRGGAARLSPVGGQGEPSEAGTLGSPTHQQTHSKQFFSAATGAAAGGDEDGEVSGGEEVTAHKRPRRDGAAATAAAAAAAPARGVATAAVMGLQGSAGHETLRALSEERRDAEAARAAAIAAERAAAAAQQRQQQQRAARGGGGGGAAKKGKRRASVLGSSSDEETDDGSSGNGHGASDDEFTLDGDSGGSGGVAVGNGGAKGTERGGGGSGRAKRRRPPTRSQPVVELPPRVDDGPPGYSDWIGRRAAPPLAIGCAAEYAVAAERYRTLHSLYRRLHEKIEASITAVHGAACTLRDAPPFGPEGPAAEAKLRAMLDRERPIVSRWDAAFKALHSELRGLKSALRAFETSGGPAAADSGGGEGAGA